VYVEESPGERGMEGDGSIVTSSPYERRQKVSVDVQHAGLVTGAEAETAAAQWSQRETAVYD